MFLFQRHVFALVTRSSVVKIHVPTSLHRNPQPFVAGLLFATTIPETNSTVSLSVQSDR